MKNPITMRPRNEKIIIMVKERFMKREEPNVKKTKRKERERELSPKILKKSSQKKEEAPKDQQFLLSTWFLIKMNNIPKCLSDGFHFTCGVVWSELQTSKIQLKWGKNIIELPANWIQQS